MGLVPLNIWEDDDRVDVRCKETTDFVASIASSVGFVRTEWLSDVDTDGGPKKRIKNAGSLDLCPDEAFHGQPLGVSCSGVLIAPDKVLTSSSCVPESELGMQSVVFNYHLKEEWSGGAIDIDPADVCRVVPESLRRLHGDELAVVSLACDEERTREPARLALTPPVDGEGVFAIGYPSMLPAKFSGRALLANVSSSTMTATATMDTMGGNSGSPVFNDRHEVVGVIRTSDTTPPTCGDEVNHCRRWRACSQADPSCSGTGIALVTAESLASVIKALDEETGEGQ